MRKIILLTSLIFIVSIGFSNSQTNKKQRGQVKFSNVIKKIEKKFDVSITYETDISFKLSKQQALRVEKMETVEEALKETLETKDISFKKIRDDYYVLSKKQLKSRENFDNNLHIKNVKRIIKGIVQDENGVSIPGATVLLEKTTNGTITDLNGEFQLDIETTEGTLLISYIGYKKERVELTEQEYYTVILTRDEFGLEEVVVSGVAGNTSTKKLTVSVQKVSESELKNVPASSSAGILQGKVPGLVMTEANGAPGSGFSMRLRGSTSLTGAQGPLIIMDGIMVQTNLADINVDDIKSVEVVKGAAAASLYGSKAGNGVIVITTKRGKDIENAFQIKVRNEYGLSELTKELDLATHHPYQLAADNDDYSYTRYEGIEYDDDGEIISGSRLISENGFADQPYANVFNHQNEFFKQGQFYTNYISLSKKSEETNMFISFENNKNTGILFSTDGYNRRNFRFNADTRIGDRLTISTSNLYVSTLTDNPGTTSGFSDALFISPDANLMDDNIDSTLYNVKPDPYNSIIENPLYPLYHRTSTSKRNSFLTNFQAKLHITDWLNIDAKYTFEKLQKYSYGLNPKGYLYMDENYISGLLTESNSSNEAKTFQSTLNINKLYEDFTLKSKLSFLYENEHYHFASKKGENFAFDDVPHFNNIDQSTLEVNSFNTDEIAMNVFGIVDIDYQDKYMLSALFREDGSSRFGPEERWNPYYRIAAAYRLTEDFKIPGVDEFKLRAAIGTAGQRPGYSWQYQTYSTSGGQTTKVQKGNMYIEPSETTEIEFAVDLSLLNKIYITAGYSIAETKGAFLQMPLPTYASDGFSYQWRNAADISSNALELMLKYNAISKNDLSLNFTVSFDKIYQEVADIEKTYKTGPNDAFVFAPGEIIGTIYGYRWLTSLSEMNEQLPEGMTIDDYEINSEGYVIEAGTEGTMDEAPILYNDTADAAANKVVIGDCNPDFNMNFGTTFSFKNISVYMLWSIKSGGNVYNYTKQYLMRDARAGIVDQYGKPESEKKSVNYYAAFYNTSYFNSYFVEDGSFIKLREASIYYNLKFKKASKYINNIRIGFVGRNLLTFTNYSGFDPEVASGSDLTNYSYDSFGYPIFRSYTASLELTF